MIPEKRLAYTIRDAVKATGLGRTTLYHAIADGSLRAVKRRSRTLILAEDLKAFLRALPAKNGRIAEGESP